MGTVIHSFIHFFFFLEYAQVLQELLSQYSALHDKTVTASEIPTKQIPGENIRLSHRGDRA